MGEPRTPLYDHNCFRRGDPDWTTCVECGGRGTVGIHSGRDAIPNEEEEVICGRCDGRGGWSKDNADG